MATPYEFHEDVHLREIERGRIEFERVDLGRRRELEEVKAMTAQLRAEKAQLRAEKLAPRRGARSAPRLSQAGGLVKPAALLALLMGCQEFALKEVVEHEPSGLAELSISPDVIDFGVGDPGVPRAEVFTLSSYGSLPVTLDSVSVTGSSAFTIGSVGAETMLEPGESLDVLVTWTPMSYDDVAAVTVTSDAETPQLGVDLYGQGLYPGIEVDPPIVWFASTMGEPVEGLAYVRSIGLADLIVDSVLLVGPSFEIEDDQTFVLAPGEERVLNLTYNPPSETDYSEGEIWLTSNAPVTPSVISLIGEAGLNCYGLGEAWDRGLLEVRTSFGGIRLYNLDDEESLCVDQWYLVLSETSQDAAFGDPNYDLSGEYPLGSVTILEEGDHSFVYADTEDDAWWCVEHEQYAVNNRDYVFTGAHVPPPMLDLMLDGDQEGSWELQEDELVIAVGRTGNLVELGLGESGETGVWVFNLGDQAGTTTVTETVPAGFAASEFSLEPDATVTDETGQTLYSWTLSLERRSMSTGNAVYDEELITYTLTRNIDCAPRIFAPEATADWSDSDGYQVSSANPLVIRCR